LFRELWNIEKSFRMSKSDLQAQPVCHRKRDSIGARLTIDGLVIALYTLRCGLNTDGLACWSPGGGLDRYVPPDNAEYLQNINVSSMAAYIDQYPI
jgi:hypothetical protein